MDYDQQNAANMGRVINNYTMILVLVTEIVAGVTAGVAPTGTQINNVVNTAVATGVPRPKPTTTIDGEVYNWMEYQQFLSDGIKKFREMMLVFQGPFEVRSRSR